MLFWVGLGVAVLSGVVRWLAARDDLRLLHAVGDEHPVRLAAGGGPPGPPVPPLSGGSWEPVPAGSARLVVYDDAGRQRLLTWSGQLAAGSLSTPLFLGGGDEPLRLVSLTEVVMPIAPPPGLRVNTGDRPPGRHRRPPRSSPCSRSPRHRSSRRREVRPTGRCSASATHGGDLRGAARCPHRSSPTPWAASTSLLSGWPPAGLTGNAAAKERM
jgi:hypothetical protein